MGWAGLPGRNAGARDAEPGRGYQPMLADSIETMMGAQGCDANILLPG
jgi:hypothetical protein